MNEVNIEQKDLGNGERNLRDGAAWRFLTPEGEAASPEGDRYLTVADAADQLGVCERTVYDGLRSGRLRGQKFGRVWRVKAKWIDEWGIENRR